MLSCILKEIFLSSYLAIILVLAAAGFSFAMGSFFSIHFYRSHVDSTAVSNNRYEDHIS